MSKFDTYIVSHWCTYCIDFGECNIYTFLLIGMQKKDGWHLRTQIAFKVNFIVVKLRKSGQNL